MRLLIATQNTDNQRIKTVEVEFEVEFGKLILLHLLLLVFGAVFCPNWHLGAKEKPQKTIDFLRFTCNCLITWRYGRDFDLFFIISNSF